MPRKGYLNYKINDERQRWLDIIASHLALDPGEHKDQATVIDFALGCTVAHLTAGIAPRCEDEAGERESDG